MSETCLAFAANNVVMVTFAVETKKHYCVKTEQQVVMPSLQTDLFSRGFNYFSNRLGGIPSIGVCG